MFSWFGCILKMLFFYQFLTLSHPFSQLPNKFYIRKSTSTHTPASTENPQSPTHQNLQKSTTIHTKPTTTQHKNHQNTTTHTTTTTTKKSEIKEREIERLREREIGLQRRRRSILGGSRMRSELNLYSSVHGWRSENERGGSQVVTTRTRCGRGGSRLVIGKVGLGCLWIGNE